MNQTMTERWNERVTPEDLVICLGDWAMGNKSQIPIYLSKLNRKKIILILGNHDPSAEKMLSFGFDEVYEQLDIVIDDKRIHLQHKPPTIEYAQQYDFVLSGHVHNQWRRQENIINCSAEVNDYYPLTFQQLLVRDIDPATGLIIP